MVGIIAVKIFVSNPKHFLPLFLKSYFFPNGSSIHKNDPQLHPSKPAVLNCPVRAGKVHQTEGSQKATKTIFRKDKVDFPLRKPDPQNANQD